MLTIFTLPKPFEGDIGRAQRNAMFSWKRLDPKGQIILCGDAPELDDIASQFELDRATGIAYNEFGTPLVSSAFRRAAELSRNEVLCYANSDLIFPPSFVTAVRYVLAELPRFLIVGECWDVSVDEEMLEHDSIAGNSWEEALRERAS